ncbi:hypothetical protein Btru_004922 [Bulinus truncatus]|nr:hypothetical protein Btru_004922 [Bulinus truncatus]
MLKHWSINGLFVYRLNVDLVLELVKHFGSQYTSTGFPVSALALKLVQYVVKDWLQANGHCAGGFDQMYGSGEREIVNQKTIEHFKEKNDKDFLL